jgi:trehalose synthase
MKADKRDTTNSSSPGITTEAGADTSGLQAVPPQTARPEDYAAGGAGGNGRPLPASVLTPPPPAPAPHLDDYRDIIGQAEVDALHFLASDLKGKTIKMVNSTAVGGGVAEMLNRLVPLLSELEVPTEWDVITGGNDFFEVTKAFHNALQGSSYDLTKSAQEIFLRYNELNRERLHFDEDLVVIHDPQPVGLVRSREKTAASWVWRCHIDLSNPDAHVWEFLRAFVEQYDAAIFSSQSFARELPIPQYLFYPCIDPLSEKNKELPESVVQKVCDEFGIDRSRPIITQVSRFDRLKDPVGVVQAYKLAKKYVDCQLVLAGGGASDDPEGAAVLQEVKEAAGNDPDIIILDLPPWCALEINPFSALPRS